MNEKTSGNQRKWYTVTVDVWRNIDGHIVRDGEKLLIDGNNRAHAMIRASSILKKVHNSTTHTILITTVDELI